MAEAMTSSPKSLPQPSNATLLVMMI